MTRDEFIEVHKHELLGILLDAVTTRRTGGSLSIWLDMAAKRTVEHLGEAFDSLAPKPVVTAAPPAVAPPAKPAAPTVTPPANPTANSVTQQTPTRKTN